MRSFFKSKYHAAIIEVQNSIQYASIKLLGTTGICTICDVQSTCAKTARDIIALIDRKQNTPQQNCRVKEEIIELLNHEKLLTHYHCNVLALLTLQEAMRLLIISSADSNQILFLQEIQLDLRQNYFEKPTPNHYSLNQNNIHMMDFDETSIPILEVLVPKHLGQGMKYLEALRKHGPFNSNIK
jgi:hypothetical protein